MPSIHQLLPRNVQSGMVKTAVDRVETNSITMNRTNTVLIVIIALSAALTIILLLLILRVSGVFCKRQKSKIHAVKETPPNIYSQHSRPTSLRIEIPRKKSPSMKIVTIPPRSTSVYGIPPEMEQAEFQTKPIQSLFIPISENRVSFVSMSSIGDKVDSLPDTPKDSIIGLGISESMHRKSVRFADDKVPTPPPKELTPREELGVSLEHDEYSYPSQTRISIDSNALI